MSLGMDANCDEHNSNLILLEILWINWMCIHVGCMFDGESCATKWLNCVYGNVRVFATSACKYGISRILMHRLAVHGWCQAMNGVGGTRPNLACWVGRWN